MFTKLFSQLSKGDTKVAGGKGASLGEMIQSGISVPDGFVVLSTTFDKFLEETDLNVEIDTILHTVDHNKVHTVEDVSEQIQSLILNSEIPEDISKEITKEFKKLDCKYVAVRSSATAEDSLNEAWAGQLDSFLNTTEENLLENVRKCWASLFTPRAIFYRFEKKLHKDIISVAVVVQKMVESEMSGIAFSVHPVTEDRNQIIIEAGFGLGEAIVSGSITPDSYVVGKEPRRIIDINVNTQNKKLVRLKNGGNEWIDLTETEGNQQVLTEQQINELTKLILKIEDHYNLPQDIEWAFQNDKFYIVQSRPITTLDNLKKEEVKTELSKFFTREHSLFYTFVWKSGNCDKASDWLNKNIEKVMFVRPNDKDIIEVWYAILELDDFQNNIIQQIKSDNYWFPKLKKEFLEHWKILSIYFNRNEPLSLKELRDFYYHWVEWWMPMSIMMQIPEISSLPKEIVKDAFRLRSETEKYSDKGDEVYFLSVENNYPKLKKYISVLLPEEVFNNKIPSNEELETRKKGWFMTNNNFGLISDLFDEMEKKNFVFENLTTNNNFIKGETANKGRTSGIVRVINFVDEINKVKEGDILVSPMTDPRYLPALKKCKAIITDEGGITCHASIVARELKKPCIIGTRIATQVLKDGDLVEVDADNGVVKILERN